MLREKGSFSIIDKVTVKLNIRKNRYEAEFSNLGISNIFVPDEYPLDSTCNLLI
ncbi:MAG TPA: anti-phage BREX system Lon protease BrxL [Massilibacterium sp.]|nr:anti-phage BREX system Lon protease BrxL [Massilibacterium sp.]